MIVLGVRDLRLQSLHLDNITAPTVRGDKIVCTLVDDKRQDVDFARVNFQLAVSLAEVLLSAWLSAAVG